MNLGSAPEYPDSPSSSTDAQDDPDGSNIKPISTLLSLIIQGLTTENPAFSRNETDPKINLSSSKPDGNEVLYETKLEENTIISSTYVNSSYTFPNSTGVADYITTVIQSTSVWVSESLSPATVTPGTGLETTEPSTILNGIVSSENVTDPSGAAKSAYFTNMIAWFIATGAIVAAVIILAFLNCLIENRKAIQKMLGLAKPKHPHVPDNEKRIRRDMQRGYDKETDYQVHMIWSQFARQGTRREKK